MLNKNDLVSVLIGSLLVSAATVATVGQEVELTTHASIRHLLQKDVDLVAWIDLEKLDEKEMATIAEMTGTAFKEPIGMLRAIRETVAPFSAHRIYLIARVGNGLIIGDQTAVVAAIPSDRPEEVIGGLKQIPAMSEYSWRIERGVVLIAATEQGVEAWQDSQGAEPSEQLIGGIESCRGHHGLAFAPEAFAPESRWTQTLSGLAQDKDQVKARLAIALTRLQRTTVYQDPKSRLLVASALFENASAAREAAAAANEGIGADLKQGADFQLFVASKETVTVPEQSQRTHVPDMLRRIREAAQRTNSMNNIRQLMLAMHNFESNYRSFPPQALSNKEGQKLLSWRVMILPFLEEGELYKQFKLDEPWDSPHNIELAKKMPAVFVSPDGRPAEQREKALTRYVAVLTRDSVMGHPGDPLDFPEIEDGTSNTLLLVEANPDHAVVWTKPDDLVVDVNDPLSGIVEPGQEEFFGSMMDGSVSAFPATISNEIFNAMVTFAGGEIPESPPGR